ncbi:MAG: hypothetical protein Q8R53_02320 [Nanoarchaeota archaeon]|nr:hypothetical protein [Nanoarchaeota archaeon]
MESDDAKPFTMANKKGGVDLKALALLILGIILAAIFIYFVFTRTRGALTP